MLVTYPVKIMDLIVTWENDYPSPLCEWLKVILCDGNGNRHSVLAIGVENRERTGSVRVRLPNSASTRQTWKVRVASELANFYGDSSEFGIEPGDGDNPLRRSVILQRRTAFLGARKVTSA